MKHLYPSLRGFTLVELLVVITIIGILIALLLPAVQAAREAARQIQCANNFKQVGVALHNYHEMKGCFPPGNINNYWIDGYSHEKCWSWSTYLLPFIEQQAVYDMIDFTQLFPGRGEQNHAANRTVVHTFICPSDPDDQLYGFTASSVQEDNLFGRTDMAAVVDSVCAFVDGESWPFHLRRFPEMDGVFGANDGCKISDIKDGTSCTLAVGEVTGKGDGSIGHVWVAYNYLTTIDGINGPNTTPGGEYPPPRGTAAANAIYDAGFASYHPGGCHFLMCDGSVHLLRETIAQEVLAALTTRDGPSSGNIQKYPAQVFSPEVLVLSPP